MILCPKESQIDRDINDTCPRDLSERTSIKLCAVLRTVFKCVSMKSGYGFAVGAHAEIIMEEQQHAESYERIQKMDPVVGTFP